MTQTNSLLTLAAAMIAAALSPSHASGTAPFAAQPTATMDKLLPKVFSSCPKTVESDSPTEFVLLTLNKEPFRWPLGLHALIVAKDKDGYELVERILVQDFDGSTRHHRVEANTDIATVYGKLLSSHLALDGTLRCKIEIPEDKEMWNQLLERVTTRIIEVP